MPSWLAQNLISSVVFAFLTVLAGVVVTILKRYKEKWASPVLYGLGAAAFAALTLFVLMFALPAVIQKPPTPVTPQNIEENIKTWADDLGIGLERQSPQGDLYPDYIARLQGGNPVRIFRAKDKPNYLQFSATLTFTAEHSAILSSMSRDQVSQFVEGLTLDLGRSSFGNLAFTGATTIDAHGNPIPSAVATINGVPISTLTENAFAIDFDELNHSSVFLQTDIS